MLQTLKKNLKEFGHRAALWRLGRRTGAEYRAYLREQLDRTLVKRAGGPSARTRLLIDALLEHGKPAPGSSVLCIGCRSEAELEDFRARGFKDVVGIDLFSERPDILVMDMHEMKFDDDSFDVIFASHSLEHSYDLARVAAEIGRVAREDALAAIELPIKYQTRGADRIDVGSAEKIPDIFGVRRPQTLFAEEQPPMTPRNENGTWIARVVLKLHKQGADGAAKPGK